MNKYFKDIFYDVSKLSLEDKINLLNDAKEKWYEYKIDKLDCSKSWARKSTKMTFKSMMKKLDNNCHFVFIHRRGYDNWKDKKFFKTTWCLEVGFSTSKSIAYFIYIKENKKDFFIKKYNLKENL